MYHEHAFIDQTQFRQRESELHASTLMLLSEGCFELWNEARWPRLIVVFHAVVCSVLSPKIQNLTFAVLMIPVQ